VVEWTSKWDVDHANFGANGIQCLSTLCVGEITPQVKLTSTIGGNPVPKVDTQEFEIDWRLLWMRPA
jgi:hypothetical protein